MDTEGRNGNDGTRRAKLMEMIDRKQKNWIWHIWRVNSMLKEVLKGRLEGKRPRGRERI